MWGTKSDVKSNTKRDVKPDVKPDVERDVTSERGSESTVDASVSVGALPHGADTSEAPVGTSPAGGLGNAGNDAVEGIVLAGAFHAGDSIFDRFLRGPLLPVAQTPVICYPLAWLRTGGITHATVCANGSTAALERYLGNGSQLQMQLRYVTEAHPRGTAGCTVDAMRASSAHTFIIVEGAMIPAHDLEPLLASHRASGATATTLVEIDRRRTGPNATHLRRPGGIYVFERTVVEDLPDHGYHDIKQELLERLYARGVRTHVHEVQGFSLRVLDFATYATANSALISSALRRPEFFADFTPVGEGLHHRGAYVDTDARLIGPVLVGADATIEAGAVIVGPTTVGAHSIVGVGAVISRSTILERCSIGAHAVVDRSLLAHGSTVPAGAHRSGEVTIGDPAAEPRGPAPAIQFRSPVHVPDGFQIESIIASRSAVRSRAGDAPRPTSDQSPETVFRA